jgi:hypothetical protein
VERRFSEAQLGEGILQGAGSLLVNGRQCTETRAGAVGRPREALVWTGFPRLE